MLHKMNYKYRTALILKCFIVAFAFILTNTANGQTVNRNALFVIDIQENLVNPNSKIHIDTAGIDLFFSNLNYAITKFQSNNDLVIYIVTEWTNPFMNWGTGNVCKKGGKGVGLDKRLVIINDNVYSKSKSNALTNNVLLNYLKENKIENIYVMGLLAEGCVKATVQGLQDENFNVTVIEDVLGSKSMKNKTKVLDNFKKRKVRLVHTNEL